VPKRWHDPDAVPGYDPKRGGPDVIYVTAISPAGATSYTGIASFRWLNSDTGKAGTTNRAGMVEFIESGKRAQVAGEDGPSEIGVCENSGTKYLRTHADGSWNNNLSNLPKF
jgi:hypothetical protein